MPPKVTNVPVIIDDIKIYLNFQMTRCTYFTVESDFPSPNWFLQLNNHQLPFYLLGLSGIIFKPFGDSETFESVELINEVFNLIESNTSLYIDTNDIWLPNFLFKEHKRGQIYRIENDLFLKAFLFRETKIDEEEFLIYCKEFFKSLYYSSKETEVFHEWINQQINEAREIYPKNKNMELGWKESTGE
jgi:hypothetical protein